MSTLVEVLSGTTPTNALSGVKRPLLGNPTGVPSQKPAFRGAPNEPGNPIKAPKLAPSNRQDRGTNVTIPVARVTALTSIAIDKGRLSPGDVVFVCKTPACDWFNSGSKKSGPGPIGEVFVNLYGIDGVNRMLAGMVNGTSKWKIGYNLFDESTAGSWESEFLGYTDPREKLEVLKMFDLDGIVLNNEEPYSFETTSGERDATVFNNVVQGHAHVNNGFLSYESSSGIELYARNFASDAFSGSMPMTSERMDQTWHSKVGFDFIASYTNRYTEYPHQMFDRSPRVLDRAYVILRKYNVLKDILEAKTKNMTDVAKKKAKMETIFKNMNVLDEDGKKVQYEKASSLYFVQYMPCTSRAFQLYRDHQEAGLVKDGFGSGKMKARVERNGITKNERKGKMDAVRNMDIEMCIGAYCIGKIVDASAARAERHRFAPVNSSYRMQVAVKVTWHNKWKPKLNPMLVGGNDYEKKSETPLLLDATDKAENSPFRKFVAYKRSKSLGELECLTSPDLWEIREGEAEPRAFGSGITFTDDKDVPTLARPPQPSITAIADRTAAPPAASTAAPTAAPAARPAPTAAPTAAPVAAPTAAPPVPTAAPAAPTAPPPGVDRSVLVPTAAPPRSKADGKKPVGSSSSKKASALVDETIARVTGAAPVAPVAPVAPKPVSASRDTVVDSVFDKIFGPQGTVPARSDAPSPTPSSGSESAPKTFSRRSR